MVKTIIANLFTDLFNNKKQKVMNSLTSQQITLVENTAKKLLHANNTVTTLEIKNQLRKDHPNHAWYQNDISDVMDYFYQQGIFDYNDNGTYRTYFDPQTATLSTSPTVSAIKAVPSTTSTTVTTPKTTSISKTKALELIKETGSKFYGVTFTKKDGTERKMLCQTVNTFSPLGYIVVKDMNEVRKGNSNPDRNVNLQTLTELKVNGVKYKIN